MLATGHTVNLAALPAAVRDHTSMFVSTEPVRPLREIEREYILAALERNHGNRTLTAQQLEIGAATLFRRLKQYTSHGRLTAAQPDGTVLGESAS